MNVAGNTEINWTQLLSDIEEKNVIPVIGNELYKFETDGKLTGLDKYLAEKLLQNNVLESIVPVSLAEAVDMVLKEKRKTSHEILISLKEAIEENDFNFPLLNQLFSINKLFFYLNTTVYYTIIEKIIKKVRNQESASINFSIRSRFKDCENIEDLDAPLIFNVFGSSKSADPALSEEDMLEFTASFQEKMNEYATDILDSLKNKTLLFLGCTNPEWLIRFLVRVLSNERIQEWAKRNSQIIIVNDLSNFRQKQYDFLKSYNAVTYVGNTNDFVEELSQRWNMKNPATVKRKTVFLSYTQKDAEAVVKLKLALSSINNIACWYDKEELYSGDNFETKITLSIKEADLFIPLVSENSLENEDRYVQEEWHQAHTFSKCKSGAYLMPIVIDGANVNNSIVKKYFKDLSVETVPGGNADEAFINRLKNKLNLI